MLYVTTRNNRDVFTSNRALTENRCPEGGHYLPFRHPRFSENELNALLEQSSAQCIAQILNLLFRVRLTGPEVDLCIGRHPVRLEKLPHRILLAECWHTPGYRFDRIVQALAHRITGEDGPASGWLEIGIRAAMLFGIFSDLRRAGIQQADISCLSGDFIMPVSAWYARRWGLPVGSILCCCNENHAVWDLLCSGQMRTDTISIPTALPAADIVVPDHLERMIYECGGLTETQRYLNACRTGRSYCPSDLVRERLRRELSISVVSAGRISETIPGVYRSHGVLMSRGTALSYAGLQDHRAKTGSTGYALVWSEEGPVAEAAALAQILGLPGDALREIL